LSQISEEESKDLINIVKFTERSLCEKFSFDKINYFMLMMVDPHLHYHVIPRYKEKQECLNQLWSDDNYPGLVDITGDEIDEARAQLIISKILN
jgi:diadenosine tetraphosphate (Ap4A) HIT family hydrolase